MICNRCGTNNRESAAFCCCCGAPVLAQDQPQLQKPKKKRFGHLIWALVLCVSVVASFLLGRITVTNEEDHTSESRDTKTEDPSEKPDPSDTRYSKEIARAISLITQTWQDSFDRTKADGYDGDDYTLKIVNAHVYVIDHDPEYKDNSHQKFQKKAYEDWLKDVKLVVNFEILSNYYGGGDYYENIGLMDQVFFYNDGTAEVKTSNYFIQYGNTAYCYDYSVFIKEMIDFGDLYNRTIVVE